MRIIFVSLLSCILLYASPAQENGHTIRIQVALVDKDLNIKPVPKLAISVVPADPQSSTAPVTVTTGFDGTVSAVVPDGKYRVLTLRPVDFEGKRYTWDVGLVVSGGDISLDLSVDNANLTDLQPGPTPPTKDELAPLFKKYRASVVTVWSEFGHGTGFIVDQKGIVLTNQHVVGPSEYIAVQFDENRKVQATLLAEDTENDIAVLWIDLSAFPEALVAPIADGGAHPTVEEGERVFTIGSPMSQRKILTTGIVSKVEARAIISDININPGNSGGPLFSSRGDVVGLTTFNEHRQAGPGISGIIRIEESVSLIAAAEAKMAMTSRPSPSLLPVEPTDAFPLDAIKLAASEEKIRIRDYVFNERDFNIALITPILKYQLMEASRVAAAKEKSKRTRKKEEAVQNTFQPLDDLRNWAEYAGEYRPVFEIQASPMLRETFGSALVRGLASSNGGYAGPAKLRFKTDFYKMRLLCGDKEVIPIQPGKVAHVVNEHNAFVNATDATYEGYYSYSADAVSPRCGKVTLELYSEKDPNKAVTKVLDPKIVDHIWSDFLPYRKLHAGDSNSGNY